MALNRSREVVVDEIGRRPWVINGMWAFQQATRDVDVCQDTVRNRIRKVVFRARQKPRILVHLGSSSQPFMTGHTVLGQ